ncbi:ElyC/SanA/YdcF family protein [Piscinibacter sakaiensis]|uniref:YdcF family protein n=1 Tax=Piscinibacter sakaiensis TaxID=1547922 RepID=UPI003728899B
MEQPGDHRTIRPGAGPTGTARLPAFPPSTAPCPSSFFRPPATGRPCSRPWCCRPCRCWRWCWPGGCWPPATGAPAGCWCSAGSRRCGSAPRRPAARSTAAPPRTAIVVLGGGRERLAPEYGQAMLGADSLQRLHYGVWLARATGLPLAFSGGRGWAQLDGEAEADLAARIAAQDYGLPLRWRENQSRDTRENARLTVALLRAEGVERILLVTHGWHMARARFRQAAREWLAARLGH